MPEEPDAPITPANLKRAREMMEKLMKQPWFIEWAKEMARK